MQKHPTNLRQAEETAAPRQKFAAPQAEIEHIKRTDRTLAGFARILKIVRDSDFFEIDQSNGGVHRDWLAGHRTDCGSCVGALLGWFFDTPISEHDQYRFRNGRAALAEYLGIPVAGGPRNLISSVSTARAAAGDPMTGPGRYNPFSAGAWGADYADVFHELARMFPGK